MPDYSKPAKDRILRKIRPLMFVVLGGVMVWSGILGWQTWNDTSAASASTGSIPQLYGLGQGKHKALLPQFSSRDGFTADLPKEPGKIQNPAVLSLAYDESDQDGAVKIAWSALAAQITAATGKQVKLHAFETDRSQMDVLHEGSYQILVVRAAETPYLVNNVGFVPFAVAGDERGPDGHRMNIVVSAKSPMLTPKDIQGHNLECSQPLSITGYRAALAFLSQTYNYRPGQDFQIIYSGSPMQSVLDLAAGTEAAVAVSNDKLASMTKSGDITPGQYRLLYESEVIPRFTVGTMFDLDPKVAEALKKTVLSYAPAVDATAPAGAGARMIRFVPINYEKDFAMVRAMDDSFESRALTATPKTATVPSVTTGAAPAKSPEIPTTTP